MRRAPVLLTTLTAAALAVGAAPASAAVPGSANDRLVAKWYTDFLGRSPDEGYTASGRDYWVGQLDRGQEPRRILEAILSSAEYADDTVDEYYDDYLGRDADDDIGANYWKSGIRADMEPEWVEQNVLASPEYERRHGDRRIERWYRAILGRSGDTGERAYWQDRVGRIGALNAVREIWYSSEAVERRIRDAYERLLDRPRDRVSGGEIDFWYDTAYDSRLRLQVEFALSEGYRPSGGSSGGEQYSGVAQVRAVRCTEVEDPSEQRTFRVEYEFTNVAATTLTYDVEIEAKDTAGNRLVVFTDTIADVQPTQTRSDRARARGAVVGDLGTCAAITVTPRL